jgi:hypothetical protein
LQYLEISINFANVNSIDKLKSKLSEIIDLNWNMYLAHCVHEGKIKKTRKLFDYDMVLKIGDYKKNGKLTHKQIAKKIFPQDFNENNSKANPESAEKRVIKYHKKYKELVNGGWQGLRPI